MATAAAPGRGLTARQRKQVYMHSTIFDDGGPTKKSVYGDKQQQDIYSNMNHKLRHNNRAPPDLDLPRSADIKATHAAGHGVVMPSTHAHHQPVEAENGSPRTSGRQVLCAEGDAIKVVKAQHHKGMEDIPKEFWKTSVNLQWHDPRNEFSRHREQLADLNAQELKTRELSSEVFGMERRTEISTRHPQRELLADSAHVMAKDSCLDPHLHPNGRRPVESGGYPPGAAEVAPAQSPRQRAQHRFQQNLRHSEHNTMKADGHQVGEAGAHVHDEDPTFAERRRAEKNFSDLFGARMGERAETRGKRNEVIWSKSCSFLDTRSEIAARNMGHWKDNTDKAPDRKSAEADSNLFDYRRPDAPDVHPEHKHMHASERICADTAGLMGAESEIARRHRMKDHHKPEGPYTSTTAFERKHQFLASDQVRQGLGVAELQKPGSPRAAGSSPQGTARSFRDAGLTAKTTKQASLQSSIFS